MLGKLWPPLILLLFICNSASATPFEGSYFFYDMLHDCDPDYRYNIEIKGDYLSSIDGHCELTNEKKIDGIGGILYFGLCMEEGDYYNEQVLIVPDTTAPWLTSRSDKGDIVLITKRINGEHNIVTHLKICPSPEEWEKLYQEEWEKLYQEDEKKNGKD